MSDSNDPAVGETASAAGSSPAGGEPRADGATKDPPQWWEDPRLPWEGEPTRADIACWVSFGLLGVYGIVLLPLRPILLALNPYALAAVTGSNIAMVDIGARLRVGSEPWWWAGLLLSALTSIKFDWVFWWAGRLWGHKIIEVMGGRSRWAARTGRWAEQMARKFGGPAVFLCWFIPFFPGAVVAAFVGDVGMKLRRYLVVDFTAGLVYRGIWMYAGYRVGEPAKEVVGVIAKYSNYLAIATLVVVIGTIWLRNRRDSATAA